MSILDLLDNKQAWQEYYNYKVQKANLTKRDEETLSEFVNNESYIAIASRLKANNYEFALPEKKLINKSGSTKKRTIYKFSEEENMMIKFISYNLYKYDNKMSDNCFSFRKNFGVKRAVDSIITKPNINNMYCYKLDISNYFNSIDIDKLMPLLQQVIDDDSKLVEFFDKFLRVDKAIYDGKVIREKRGAMAGTSLSTFFANIYLKDLDKYFAQQGVIYARYSDDIIMFAQNLQELERYRQFTLDFLQDKNLIVNTDKEAIFEPHTAWTFLGIEYCDGKIDLSPITIKKLKDKIHRKARALYRWQQKKQVSCEKTTKVMLKIFNRKFYEQHHVSELTWSRWFFPLITTSEGLKQIDHYFVQYLRYLATGKHSKLNYNTRYQQLKNLGFKSLVNEYYKYLKAEQ